jgi:rhomboid protease GluP
MAEAPPVGGDRTPPMLIWALLAALAAVFLLELFSAGALEPSVATLIAMGGLSRSLVLEGGEWYRLFAAPLLHGSVVHLLLNGLALLIAGGLLERLVGRAWLLALFAIGALGGSLMSLALNAATIVSVGASGAIMGLLAAGFVQSYRLPRGAPRTQVQIGMLQMLVPSLIPLATSLTGEHVDFAAHLGGALAGGAAGFVLLKLWPPRFPALPWVGHALAALGLGAFAWAVVAAATNYASYAAELIPDSELPKTDAAGRHDSAALVARYPRDPRAHLLRAGVLLDAGDKRGAEQELRAALAEEQTLRANFRPELEWRVRTLLALVLAEESRAAEAAATAKPVCAAPAPAAMREALVKAQLCEAPRH